MFIVKIIYAIMLIAWGCAIIRYRKIVKSWTGNFIWAEHYLWRWWTYFIILLVGLGMIFYWTIYPFGWAELLFWK